MFNSYRLTHAVFSYTEVYLYRELLEIFSFMREKPSVYNANKAMTLSLSCFLQQAQLVARTPWTDVRGDRRAGG